MKILNRVLAFKSVWVSGEDPRLLLGFLGREYLVASEVDGSVLATLSLADPMGHSKLFKTESRVGIFCSHIRQSLAMSCPLEYKLEQETFLQLQRAVPSEGTSHEPSATGWIPRPCCSDSLGNYLGNYGESCICLKQ